MNKFVWLLARYNHSSPSTKDLHGSTVSTNKPRSTISMRRGGLVLAMWNITLELKPDTAKTKKHFYFHELCSYLSGTIKFHTSSMVHEQV